MADNNPQQTQQPEKVPSYEVPAIPSHSEIMGNFETATYEDRIEIARTAMERTLDECGIDFLDPSDVTLSPDRVPELPKEGFEDTRKKLGRPQIFTTKPKRKSGYHLTVARLNNSENPEENTIVFFKSGHIKHGISLKGAGTWGVMSEKDYNEFVTDKKKKRSIHGKFLRGKMDSFTYGRKINKYYKDMFGMNFKEYINQKHKPESQEDTLKLIERLKGEYTETLQIKSQEVSQAVDQTETKLTQLEKSQDRFDLAKRYYKALKEANTSGFLTPELEDWLKPEGLDEEVAKSISGTLVDKESKESQSKTTPDTSTTPKQQEQPEPPEITEKNTEEGKGAFTRAIQPLVNKGKFNKETFLELAEKHSLDTDIAAEVAAGLYKSKPEETTEELEIAKNRFQGE